jgi:hypothetical protein
VSVEDRVRRFVDTHTRPIRAGLALAGSLVIANCTPVDVPQPDYSTAVPIEHILPPIPTPDRILAIRLNEAQQEDIRSLARVYINPGYILDGIVTLQEDQAAFDPARREAWAVLQIVRGQATQPFLIRNTYGEDDKLTETHLKLSDNHGRGILNFLPTGELYNNSSFFRSEANLEHLAKSIFVLPREPNWEDTSFFQEIPGINLRSFTGRLDTIGRAYEIKVMSEEPKVINDLTRDALNYPPSVHMTVKYLPPPKTYFT